MNRCIASLLLSVCVPGVAVAQDLNFSGGLTLGFGTHDISDISQGIQTTTLNGRVNLDFGNGVSMGAELGYIDIGIDDVPVNLEARNIGLDGKYTFANGASVGAYYEQLTFGIDDVLPIDLSLTSYGLTGGYKMDTVEFGGFLGMSETSPTFPGFDIVNYGLTARYTGVQGLTLGGAVMRANLSAGGGDDANIDFVGVAADYAFNDKLSVFGGVGLASIDVIEIDSTTFGIGVAYHMPEISGVNSTLSLEVANSNLSFNGTEVGDLGTVRLGLTIPLGGKGKTVPMNSVADSILNPRHGALNTALTAAF